MTQFTADSIEKMVYTGQLREVITACSHTIKTATSETEQLQALLLRSRALVRLALRYKTLPASESERRAEYGMDPMYVAQLGLEDAKRAATIAPDSSEAFLLQAESYLTLEQYSEAHSAYVHGLTLDPSSAALHKGLNEASELMRRTPILSEDSQAAPESSRGRRNIEEDAECSLCMKLLYEPVTTPCGHSFCRNCFLRAADHSSKCPICRTVLHVGREIPVTLVLRQLIQHSFPDEYEARRKDEQDISARGFEGAQAALPLFVMSSLLPGEKMRLNIFEPRYRLMVRRCMEGSRRFGMAFLDMNDRLHPIACEAEILVCQPVPDGRYLLEIQGTRRLHLSEIWEQDGYRIANPDFFRDVAPQPGSEEAEELAHLAAYARERAEIVISRLSRMAPLETYMVEQLRQATASSQASDHELLSFWYINILQLNRAQRIAALDTKHTRDRLKLVMDNVP